MSLMEVVVTVSLLTVVLSVFFGVVVSVQSALTRQIDRSRSNDQARLAVEQLDREIRSGNVLYDPTLGESCQPPSPVANCVSIDASHGIYPGMSLMIYTQANAPTRGQRCVQWRVQSGKLQRRDWSIGATPATSWRIVADHLANVTGTSPAFTVDPAKRIVSVTLLVNQNAAHGSTVRLDTNVQGRNTVYGGPPVCDPTPPLPY
jgi:type II secretory pathway component PulJ